MRPVIGVMPLWDDRRKSLWMLPGYVDGIRDAGGVPVLFPLTAEDEELRQLCEMCDGFLFTGGHDVSAELYGEKPLPGTIACRPRDDMEWKVLDFALRADRPVLGICRGIQVINAALGGTLYQDIPTQVPSDVEHNMKPPYDRAVHTVRILKNTPLHDLLGLDELGVNSYHHQAVKTLPGCLVPMAQSPDGLVEAVYLPGKRYVWAVQWHPEMFFRTEETSRKIFASFVGACREGNG